MATTAYPFPRGSQTVLPPTHVCLGGTGMFNKEEPPGWPQDPMHFAKRASSIRNAAQCPCSHYSIDAIAFEWDRSGLSILTLLIGASQSFAAGNPAQGQRAFGACAACHSLRPDENMTGPSLAGLWNRKAVTLASFSRYSPAMKSADIEWNDKTLDEWIDDPQ